MNVNDFSVVLLAAGNGRRMKVHENKNFIEVKGRPLVSYTIEAFVNAGITEIVLVTNSMDIGRCQDIVDKYNFPGVKVIAGGERRSDSAEAGLSVVTKPFVLIHDSARAFVTKEVIKRCMKGTFKYDACIAAMPLKDTVKIQASVVEAGDAPRISATPQRSLLWQAQTPQGFRTDLIREAYWKAYESGAIDRMTDDAQTVERLGRSVHLTEGDYTNIKVTEANDLIFAEAILSSRMSKD